MVEAVKQNYPQREIADASYELQGRIDHGDRIVVGVNQYTEGDDGVMATLRIDPALERKQIDRVQAVRGRRSSGDVQSALARLRQAAADDDENLMPHLLDAARVHASEGEIVGALQDVFGSYTETPVF
jgi:methylmalonyl-CoA mutase N-terminal domain/subunit